MGSSIIDVARNRHAVLNIQSKKRFHLWTFSREIYEHNKHNKQQSSYCDPTVIIVYINYHTKWISQIQTEILKVFINFFLSKTKIEKRNKKHNNL
jgi:hypothetical protein